MKTPRRTVAAALAIAAAFTLSACTTDTTDDRKKAQEISGDQQKKYEAAAPFPAGALNNPLDRKNLIEYLKRNNDPDRVSYVYTLSDNGNVIAYYTIKGKVTAVDSQLLPVDDIQHACSGCDWFTTDSAGDDGTYGGNERGVFFFTTDGALVTWTGQYLQSDRPLDIKTPVTLVAKVN